LDNRRETSKLRFGRHLKEGETLTLRSIQERNGIFMDFFIYVICLLTLRRSLRDSLFGADLWRHEVGTDDEVFIDENFEGWFKAFRLTPPAGVELRKYPVEITNLVRAWSNVSIRNLKLGNRKAGRPTW
jgi:hypothetical protein